MGSSINQAGFCPNPTVHFRIEIHPEAKAWNVQSVGGTRSNYTKQPLLKACRMKLAHKPSSRKGILYNLSTHRRPQFRRWTNRPQTCHDWTISSIIQIGIVGTDLPEACRLMFLRSPISLTQQGIMPTGIMDILSGYIVGPKPNPLRLWYCHRLSHLSLFDDTAHIRMRIRVILDSIQAPLRPLPSALPPNLTLQLLFLCPGTRHCSLSHTKKATTNL